ncbi:MAG: glycerol-3-phosphate dehydrogenase, partial [Solirubrobacteraceae bacterium]|nr:glycerol-3-phosphate dehydrogenase [Solirubrobacteraceae bacterium]
MAADDAQVAVIGGGVVGCAVAHALARRGVGSLVLEAEQGLALAASGANSGILHTGFDSEPGTLETRLILRSAALREQLLDDLAVPMLRCGARLTPREREQRAAVERLAENAHRNGVSVALEQDGSLAVPGEAVTDPVAFVHALAAAARSGGAAFELNAPVVGLAAAGDGAISVELLGGEARRVRAVVNCAGLHADDVARMAGEQPVSIYPRKGEFLVFSPAEPLREILLPVPTALG